MYWLMFVWMGFNVQCNNYKRLEDGYKNMCVCRSGVAGLFVLRSVVFAKQGHKLKYFLI